MPEHMKLRLTGPKGSRWKEWSEITAVGPDGTKAVRVHRGAAAADLFGYILEESYHHGGMTSGRIKEQTTTTC